MVGLHGTLGNQMVGALGQRVAHQELQLANLVAAETHARQVVALHPNLRPAQRFGEAGQQLQRGRSLAQLGARECGEVHGRPPVDGHASSLVETLAERSCKINMLASPLQENGG